MVCIVSPRDRYTDIVPQISIALCLLGRSPYGIARVTPSVQSSHFKMVEMDRIVGGKRGWVTRGLREYVGKGDRSFFAGDRPPCKSHYLVVVRGAISMREIRY
ncbi:hypothetical protein QUB68_23965 [Microcoleus sp. A006_D1]|uniref:hypothetical protein n=1 Tax=Microcoleus sp. A006_D1 TaxID=3055267 RepID=UPI002FD1E300